MDFDPYVTLNPEPARTPNEVRLRKSLSEHQKKEQLRQKRREALQAREADPSIPTEKKALIMLARHFDQQRNRIFIRSMTFGWEMDFCMVTGSRILHEIEVKVSLADWNHDREKDKWAHSNQAKVGRFWYAVPGPLISKKPDWVQDHVGLIAISQQHVTIFKPAKLISNYRVTDAELNQMYQSMYFRWWTQALRKGEV